MPVSLFRIEGLKQIGHNILGDAGSGIGYRDLNHVIRDVGIRYDELLVTYRYPD
jgi:hypothetical protein